MQQQQPVTLLLHILQISARCVGIGVPAPEYDSRGVPRRQAALITCTSVCEIAKFSRISFILGVDVFLSSLRRTLPDICSTSESSISFLDVQVVVLQDISHTKILNSGMPIMRISS